MQAHLWSTTLPDLLPEFCLDNSATVVTKSSKSTSNFPRPATEMGLTVPHSKNCEHVVLPSHRQASWRAWRENWRSSDVDTSRLHWHKCYVQGVCRDRQRRTAQLGARSSRGTNSSEVNREREKTPKALANQHMLESAEIGKTSPADTACFEASASKSSACRVSLAFPGALPTRVHRLSMKASL